jgi:hypothetical protein
MEMDYTVNIEVLRVEIDKIRVNRDIPLEYTLLALMELEKHVAGSISNIKHDILKRDRFPG